MISTLHFKWCETYLISLKLLTTHLRELQSSTNTFRLTLFNRDTVGMIEIRDYQHISLLFVDSNYHRQGIGKKLWIEAFKKCIHSSSKVTSFTVNSSPFAVPIYEKLGFSKVSEEQVVTGIRFYQMLLRS
jgi:predicted GNAT family N-acyltransferase